MLKQFQNSKIFLLLAALLLSACQADPIIVADINPMVTSEAVSVTEIAATTTAPAKTTVSTPSATGTLPSSATPKLPKPTVTVVAATATLPISNTNPIVLTDDEAPGDNNPGVEVTFICNEGFLFTSSQGQKVLVDAFPVKPSPFGALSPEQRTLIEKAQPPFDQIDLILITHDHYDHYDFNLLRKHMKNDPKTILVSVENITYNFARLYPDRVVTIKAEEGESKTLELNGIKVDALGLRQQSCSANSPSGGRRYDYSHIGFLVTLDGKRILHTGDFDDTIGLPSNLGEIDLALMPHWATSEPQAKHIIQMHWEEPFPYASMQTWILK